MKILSLYIDKWYMVGAVVDGANKTPLALSNAESRIWLYFYSNSTTNAVRYSLGYKDKALAGEKGCYADVFDLLPDYKRYFYQKFGASKKMSEIFADAGILADLQKSYGEGSPIPVYIAFSEDIDIVAQHLFLKTLEKEHFDVLQHTLPIERLALEHLSRKGQITEVDSNVLVVNACNENLRYSIYNVEGEDFSVVAQECVPGYGGDSRKQAVVEEVMEYMQSATNFLSRDRASEEWHDEMLFLSQYAEKWLQRVDRSPGYAPVALGDIHFKKQASAPVPVVVAVSQLNDRTKNIVGMLTDKIVDTVKKARLLLPQIEHVVFLGDTFSNGTFAETLQQKIGFSSSKTAFFPENSLPDLVETYSKWDETAFDEEKKASVAAARKKYIEDSRKFIESQTQEQKDKGSKAEAEGRLQEALDLYRQVLDIDPDDRFSQARLVAIEQQIKLNEEIQKQVGELLHNAHECYSTNDFGGTLNNCDAVLQLQPDNREAQKLKDDADDMLRRLKQLEVYIDRMKELLIKSRFFDARNVLQEADGLRINDARLKNLREEIDNGIAKLESKINDLTKAYDEALRAGDYQRCIDNCCNLISIGADSTEWSRKKQNAEEKLRQEQQFNDNRGLARKARNDQKWTEVVEYVQKALGIKDDKELREWMQEAEKALRDGKKARVQEEFSLACANEQWEQVVDLYKTHEFLKEKYSNSKMYDKAVRILNSPTSRVVKAPPPRVSPSNPPSSTKQGGEGSTKTTRPEVKRPTRSGNNGAESNEQDANGSDSRSAQTQTNGTRNIKITTTNKPNRITNKPKR